MKKGERYKLITFYNQGTQRQPIWGIYAHYGLHSNDYIDSFQTKADAMMKAHKFGLPVMNGSSHGIGFSSLLELIFKGKESQHEDKKL